MKARNPSRFSVRLAIKLCPPKGWHLDAAKVIHEEIRKELSRARKNVRKWRDYLDESDGVE